MNKQEVKEMIVTLEKEMSANEERIEGIIIHNDQLNVAKMNLEHWLRDDQTSVTAPVKQTEEPVLFEGKLFKDSTGNVTLKPKRRISPAGIKRISAAQKARWARTKILTPFPKNEPVVQKKSKKHWTQLPKNRKKVLARIRKMNRINKIKNGK